MDIVTSDFINGGMDSIIILHLCMMPELPALNSPNDYGTYQVLSLIIIIFLKNVVNTLNGDDSAMTNAGRIEVVEIIERIYSNRK